MTPPNDQEVEWRTAARLQQYRAMVEASGELFAIADANYRYVLVNEAYAAWHGYPRSEIEGNHITEILGTEHFERDIRPAIDRCLAGKPQHIYIERALSGGEPRQLLARYYPTDAPDGRTRHVVASFSDITELKRTEVALEEKQRLIDMAGQVARLGGWSADLQTGRVEWSDVVAEFHGMPHGYAPTIDEIIAFYAPEWRKHLSELFNACSTQGEPFDEELQIVTPDRERVWVRVSGQPIHNDAGQIVRVEGMFQDITQRRQYESHLRQMHQIVEQSPAPIAVTDRHGCIEYVNPSFESISGYSRDELIGATPALIQSGETPETTYRQLWQTITSGGVWSAELQNRRKNGELYWEYEVISPVTDDNGNITQYVAIKEDITERKRAEAELRLSHDRLTDALNTRQALINSLPANIALLDVEGNIVDVNEQWRQFARENGYNGSAFGMGANYIAVCEAADGGSAEEAQAAAAGIWSVLAGERNAFVLEYPCHSPEQHRWFRLMATRLTEADTLEHGAAVVMHVDITERKLAERELTQLAYEDALTRLPSRNGFVRAAGKSIERDGWQPDATVVLLDLKRLHDINQAHGYATGDAVLIEVGRRLQQAAGDGGIVGRIGGDEFAVFLPQRNDRDTEQQRVDIAAVFQTPLTIDTARIDIGAHVGYTVLGDIPRETEELVRESELALFQSRLSNARDPWSAYTADLDEAAQQRVQVTGDLRVALAQEQFKLHFQPKVELDSGRLQSAEALLRWSHPERGLISPGVFIPIAEQSQLIGPIGNWVLREACRCIRSWHNAGLDLVPVSVNISLIQLTTGNFAATVRDALDAYHIAPENLSLEITESAFEEASEGLLSQLREIHDLGVRLSLDDFGTGYSSLLYLQQYPFDEIKIDQGFVRGMRESHYNQKIVEAVMNLADALGAEVVAEGVEDAATRDALLTMGCRQGQGFYYSMPLAGEDFRWLLERGSTLPLSG